MCNFYLFFSSFRGGSPLSGSMKTNSLCKALVACLVSKGTEVLG